MDARTIIGLLLFVVFVALVKWLVIDAIWKAAEPDGTHEPSPENGGLPEIEQGRCEAIPFKPLTLLKPDS
jgi:hypothetical protein